MRIYASVLCLVSLVMSPSILAGTVLVSTTADSGPGSLRDVIIAADPGDTIQFAPELSGQNIELVSGELLINTNLTIDGLAAKGLTVKRSSTPDTPNFRIFNVGPGHTVIIRNLTINNGVATGSHPCGGGIYNDGSNLTVTDCNISGNSAPVGGGGICNDGTLTGIAILTVDNCTLTGNTAIQFSGGGILNFGEGGPAAHAVATVSNCVISGNSADFSGGGVDNDGQYYGNAELTVSSCTVTGNSVGSYGGGIDNNADYTTKARVTVNRSTISGNTSNDRGGGITNNGGIGEGGGMMEINDSTIDNNMSHNSGGGIENHRSTLMITNSTISGNHAGHFGSGGAIDSDATAWANQRLVVEHCTISNNFFFFRVCGINPSGPAEIRNTVLNANGDQNIGGTIVSHGYNISSDDSSSFYLTGPGDQINTDPKIGPLQANGGPTLTHQLLLDSPAINTGDPNFVPPPENDQRGPGFPRVVSGRTDIGSFEVQQLLPTPTPGPTGTPGPTSTPSPVPSVSPTPSPSPTSAPGTTVLGNISTRLVVQTGDNVLIGGFIVTGTQPKRTILRVIGPTLSSFFPNALADPILELHDSSGHLIAANDNWRSAQEQDIIATGIQPFDDLEPAIVQSLPANGSAYTAIVRGVNNGTGIGVVEAYDLDLTADSRLANISTRGFVQTVNEVLIGGLIVVGPNSVRVIVRAIGPSLSVPGALSDPALQLYDNNGVLIAVNNNWRTDQEAEVIATGIPPSNDLESSIVRDLLPGDYTAIVRGVNDTSGVALVEIYALN